MRPDRNHGARGFDVLAWLKTDGKGYQTRLNSILRKAMLKEVAKA